MGSWDGGSAVIFRRVRATEPACGVGGWRLLAAVTSPGSIAKGLQAMGLSATVRVVAAAREPPGGDAEWFRQQAERKVRERLRVSHGGGKRRGARRRCPWAALLQRAQVYTHLDVEDLRKAVEMV